MSAGRVPLIVLGGWLAPASLMEPFLGSLGARYQIHPVDLPGSGSADGGAWDPAGLADRLAAGLDRPALWLGWSLGAQVALEAARRHPQRVRGVLAVAGTPCFCSREDWGLGRPPAEVRAMRRRLARDPGGLATDVGRRIGLPLALPAALTPARRRALDDGLQSLAANDYRRDLSALTVPVYWCGGERDALVAAGVPAAAAALSPAGRAVALPGAGHAPFDSHRQGLTAALAALDEETL